MKNKPDLSKQTKEYILGFIKGSEYGGDVVFDMESKGEEFSYKKQKVALENFLIKVGKEHEPMLCEFLQILQEISRAKHQHVMSLMDKYFINFNKELSKIFKLKKEAGE